MRYALLSDVHANRPALEAVLRDIARRDVRTTYQLGDLVGYGPWPNEVVAMIAGARIPGVAGNYDSTVAAGYKHCGCRYEDHRQEALSRQSFEWTRAHATAETKAYLASLPFRIDHRSLGGHAAGPTVRLLHGNQTLNTVYVTEDRSDEFLAKMSKELGARTGDVVCFGHTHKPWHRTVDGVHFVNTGSVGRPKDGDWRAGYVLLDVDAARVDVEFVRLEYDLEEAIAAIHASDLPNELADVLAAGATA